MRLVKPNKKKISINDINDQNQLDEKKKKRRRQYQEKKIQKQAFSTKKTKDTSPTKQNDKTEILASPPQKNKKLSHLFIKPPEEKFLFPWEGGSWVWEEDCKEITTLLQSNADTTFDVE